MSARRCSELFRILTISHLEYVTQDALFVQLNWDLFLMNIAKIIKLFNETRNSHEQECKMEGFEVTSAKISMEILLGF